MYGYVYPTLGQKKNSAAHARHSSQSSSLLGRHGRNAATKTHTHTPRAAYTAAASQYEAAGIWPRAAPSTRARAPAAESDARPHPASGGSSKMGQPFSSHILRKMASFASSLSRPLSSVMLSSMWCSPRIWKERYSTKP